MLRVLDQGHDSDVSFKIGGKIVAAHKVILRMNAPGIFTFCEESDGDSPIPIDNTSSEIFRMLLRYVYGGEVPNKDTILKKNKDILDAADRYGLIGLKQRVEATLVESLIVDKTNVADWLIFSDAKTCPLLKEYATLYFLSRSADILKSDRSKLLKESPKLLTELLLEMSKNSDTDERFDDESNLSVNELRKQLHEKDLDIDGSHEMLVSRLQSWKKRKREE